jgi:acyl-CoA synthetase (AMP-forming)/AMP-acid ligase II
MGLEIDYVAAAHAVWLSGRTAVVLSPKWSQAIMDSILKRTNVSLVIYGKSTPAPEVIVRSFCTFDCVPTSPPLASTAPDSSEFVDKVPMICSVTPTSGSTGVPKSIVYPMRKTLSVLDEESSTILKPADGQWLRGGTTFLRPLFEIRRFMFNQTTLYLDPAIAVADQCASLCAELEDQSNPQPLRVHFTPSVFRAFVDFVKMKYGADHSFNRLYWMVIGGESLSVTDLTMAKHVFPNATLACNYACSEVGFAGVCQMFVRPNEPVPELVNFNATQGCEDLVLLDEEMNIIPKHEGASGIIGIITTSSATHYMGNEEASKHMFRPWGGDRILLYTDDIGNMAADGRIAINGRRSRNVKINGLFVDMDHVEAALIGALDGSVVAYKLVKSGERIVLFWTGEATNMQVLKRSRDALRRKLGDNLAMVLSSTRRIDEMPYNASYKVDLARLQAIADEDGPVAVVEPIMDIVSPLSRTDAVADEIAAEVAKLSKASSIPPTDVPLVFVGLNSLTVVQLYFWLQEHYDYDDDMSRLFEEEVSALSLARDITGEDPVSEGALTPTSRKIELASGIAQEVARLAQSLDPVPTDMPLTLFGLNSITAVQLYFWLQEHYAYDDDMSRLFADDCSAEALAFEILGEDDDDDLSDESITEVDELEAEVKEIAEAVAAEVARLSRSSESVPTDVPLMLAGLNSITVIQLHFWLQSEYDYEDEMSRLFEDDVSAEVVARDILSTTATLVDSDEEEEEKVVGVEPTPVASISKTVKIEETSENSDSDELLPPVPMFLLSGPGSDSKPRRVIVRPTPLDLSSSPHDNMTPKVSKPTELAPPPLSAGLHSAGLRTPGGGLSQSIMYGLLAMSILSSTSHSSPRPSRKIPSLNVLAEPVAPSSPWMSEIHSPGRMLCV